MYNRVVLIGRVGTEPELKYLPDGTPVANFRLATQEYLRNKKVKEWHSIAVFGKLAQIVRDNLGKGRLIGLEGRLHTRSWEENGKKRYSVEVIAERVFFLDRKEDITEDLPF